MKNVEDDFPEDLDDLKRVIMEEVDKLANLPKANKFNDDVKAGYLIALEYIGSFVEIRNKLLVLDFVEKHFKHNQTLDKRLFKENQRLWEKFHKEKKEKMN